jgi:hypothetical protein
MAFCKEVNDAVREYGCEFIYTHRTDKPTPAEWAAAREAQKERLEHKKKVKAKARKERARKKRARSRGDGVPEAEGMVATLCIDLEHSEPMAELKKPLKKKTKKNKKKEKKAEQKVDQLSDAISAIL